MSDRLAGKVALVTGGASGLGAAIVRRFVAEGAKVVIADIDDETGRHLASDLGPATFHVWLDVANEAAWGAAIAKAQEGFGRLDVLVNNAGIALLKGIEDTTLAEWRRVLAVNLDGVFLGCKAALPAMKAVGGGSIVNLSSVAGLTGAPNLAAYSASKGGVRLLTKSVALYCAKAGYGIRCNSVHPVFVNTPMFDNMLAGLKNPPRAREGLAASVPLGRIAEPEDVVGIVVFLASDEARFVTGAEFAIDGGFTAA